MKTRALPRRVRGRRPQAREPLPPARPFPVFLAYADVPAARNALVAIRDALRAHGGNFALQPMLWRFSQLADPKWRERALADTALASVVVLASTEATADHLPVEAWIADLLARRRGLETTLVALLGPDDQWTISIEQPAALTSFPPAATLEQLVA